MEQAAGVGVWAKWWTAARNSRAGEETIKCPDLLPQEPNSIPKAKSGGVCELGV